MKYNSNMTVSTFLLSVRNNSAQINDIGENINPITKLTYSDAAKRAGSFFHKYAS